MQGTTTLISVLSLLLLIPRIHNVETETISNGGDTLPGDNIENNWKKHHIDTIVVLAAS